jgi:hypothetical protein
VKIANGIIAMNARNEKVYVLTVVTADAKGRPSEPLWFETYWGKQFDKTTKYIFNSTKAL